MRKGWEDMGIDEGTANDSAERTRKQIGISTLDAGPPWNIRMSGVMCNGKDLYGK